MVTLLIDWISNKMKNAKYHIIGTVPKSNRTNRRKRQKTIHLAYIRCKMSSLLMKKVCLNTNLIMLYRVRFVLCSPEDFGSFRNCWVLKYSLKCTTDEQFYDFAFIIVYLMKFSSFLSFLCCPIMCLCVLSSVLGCPLSFLHRNDVRFVFAYSCLLQGSCVIYVSCACLGIIVSNT